MGFDNESGAAYTFVMVIVLIFLAALIFAYLIPTLNVFTKQVNRNIEARELSSQTVYVYQWNLSFFQWTPAIGLIGFAIFCIVRSIEVAEAGYQGG